MNIEFLTAPLVGAVIGYITNDLAIRMLFHPYKAVYIGKFKLPFTPGIIPKEQHRIAKSLGNVISDMLLDEETLTNTLLSDEVIKTLEDYIDEYISKFKTDTRSINECLNEKLSEKEVAEAEEKIADKLSDAIESYAVNKDIGEMISKVFLEKFAEQKNGAVSKFILPILEGNIKVFITDSVNSFVKDNIKQYSLEFISEKIEDIKSKQLCEITVSNEAGLKQIKAKLISTYKVLVENQLSRILKALKINEIVENKIMSFEAAQLEEMIFGIMKKELKTVVNIGAILGLLIGFVNVFI